MTVKKNKDLRTENVLRTFMIPKYLIEIADLNRDIRKKIKTLSGKESFSEYIRRLIEEDWRENKKILKRIKRTKARAEAGVIKPKPDLDA